MRDELSDEEAGWLLRISRGRLLKDPLELGMPDGVRSELLAKGLAIAQGGLLEISPEGLAEALRRGEPLTPDSPADRARVMLVVSPMGDDGLAATDEARQQQRFVSGRLLRIAVDAAIINHEASKLLAADAAGTVPGTASNDALDDDVVPAEPSPQQT